VRQGDFRRRGHFQLMGNVVKLPSADGQLDEPVPPFRCTGREQNHVGRRGSTGSLGLDSRSLALGKLP
jgi:hypothetical protein